LRLSLEEQSLVAPRPTSVTDVVVCAMLQFDNSIKHCDVFL